MFFILSKILFYMVMPLLWITIILFYSIFTKNPRKRKLSIIVALSLILFFGNDFIINELFKAWEKKPIPTSAIQKHDYAIVLTGITNSPIKGIEDRTFFAKGADRLLHTVQLYKEGYVKKIIISGGSSSIITEDNSEAQKLKTAFLYCGIPESNILIEDKAKNTHENALFTKKLIDSAQLKGNFLLVTSAFHMRRAACCFNKTGLKFNTFPVDIYTRETIFTPNYTIIPSEAAFSKWFILIHEVLGFIVYKIVGYC